MKSYNENLIKKIFQKKNKTISKYFYPLLDNAFSKEDLIAGIKVLISGQITMSKKSHFFFSKKYNPSLKTEEI